MFAERTNWNLTGNRLSEALARHRASGKPLFDLTASNPTECGFAYDSDLILAALRNPYVHLLGHPRGRIYNYRIGLRADWPRIFAEATRLDKALEVDCYPDRQDLNVDLLKVAREHGTRISLGTDAHHPWQLEFIELGLAAALRAQLPAQQIVNFMSIPALRNWIQGIQDPTQ